MKGYIPADKIEEIKNRTDIVSVISEYLTLKKVGRNFRGLCPFHKEKTPSFTINYDKQIFYCFGCGEAGNVITFLMKINNISYPEAVRYLARKTGVVIPERVMSREEKERIGLREQLNRVNEMAAVYFSKNLSSPAGKGAREYLRNRGIQDTALIGEFRLGFALDGWRHLRDFLEREGVPLKLAEQAGLITRTDEGDLYDRFRGRLIFPIEDVGGHVIAFGGRILGDGEPKYLNSPESPVYVKGKNLYGLAKTREAIQKKGYAILVEGYFDLIALLNAGITNVVAPLGTALTKDQIGLIRRYTGDVVAIFDPDEGGKKALARSLELFLAGNIRAKAVILPDNYDPDRYVRTYGRESLEEIITHAPTMVDYYIENIVGKKGGTIEDTSDAVHRAVSFIANIDDAIKRNLFIKRVAEKLGIDQELLKMEVRNSLTPSNYQGTEAQRHKGTKADKVELSLIHIMLEYPDKIPAIVETGVLDYFMNEELRALGKLLHESPDRDGMGGLDTFLIIDRLGNESLRGRLLKLVADESPYNEKVIDQLIDDTIKQIKRKWYKEKLRTLETKLTKAEEVNNGELCGCLLEEITRRKSEEQRL
ncbi:MAG: DNA primase [Syntrophales bacterium]|nr:DNA primase [Syntrophales bacterium]